MITMSALRRGPLRDSGSPEIQARPQGQGSAAPLASAGGSGYVIRCGPGLDTQASRRPRRGHGGRRDSDSCSEGGPIGSGQAAPAHRTAPEQARRSPLRELSPAALQR